MNQIIGTNTPAAERVNYFVERLERIDAAKKELSNDEKLVMAEVQSEGFSKRGIQYVRKARKMKPQDLRDFEIERDIYMHAAGLDVDLPLFRQIETAAKDTATKGDLIEAFKALVPQTGEIILKMGDRPVRMWRDADGNAQVEDYIEASAPAPAGRSAPSPAPRKDVPECSSEEAEEMGRQAARDNQAIISNPFPFDDNRRPRWDLGWRKEAGSDGMGPGKK